jgi:uncharacterized membrane protein YbhN (UPF0104 family)
MKLGKTFRTVAQNVVIYGIAGAIVWYEARGVPVQKVLNSLAHANLFVFIPASIASFCVGLFGVNLLYARMFSHFHRRTGYAEVLPATAATFFLQLVNTLVANGALVLFLHRRKDVPWLAGGFTLAFLGFIDGCILSLMTVLSAILIPGSPLRRFLPYAAGALAALLLIAAWWLWRTPSTRIERWLRERPSLVSFRTARPRTYFELGAIRLAIFVPQGFIFYVAMLAFHLNVGLLMVLGLTPAIIAAENAPVTPVGLGPLQLLAVHEFARFSSAAQVLAMYLSMSMLLLLYRLPLGLGSAGAYARTVLKSEREGTLEPEEQQP